MLVKDLCIIQSNNYQKKDKWDHFNYLDTSNLTRNNLDSLQFFKYEKDLPSRAKQKVELNNILYSSVRPNQEHYGFVDKGYDNLLVSTGFIILKPLTNRVHPKFLFYFLTQKDIVRQLQTIAQNSTSSYPSISNDDLLNLKINLPSLKTQEKVVSILSLLDQQIERNNTVVKRLQVLAHNTFDYFSKNNDRSNFVILKDIIIEKEKSTIQVNNIEDGSGNIPFFTSGETILYTSDALTNDFNIYLSTGGNAKVQAYYGDASYSTDTWCISAKNKLQYYLFGYLKHIESQMYGLYFHGTGLKHLQKPLFLQSHLNIPDDITLKKYNAIIEPIHRQISQIQRSTIGLQKLKNQLLPLLINQQLV